MNDQSIKVSFPQVLKVIIGLCFLVFLIPNNVFASNQLIHDTASYEDISQGTYALQTLGNGMSGDITSVSVWMGITGSCSFNCPQIKIQIGCYDDDSYSTQNETCTSPLSDSFVLEADTNQEYDYTLAVPLTLNPNKYYGIVYQCTTYCNNAYERIWGSATNSVYGYLYTDDDPWIVDTDVADAYYIFNDVQYTDDTRIVSIEPTEGATTTSPVTINIELYKNSDDNVKYRYSLDKEFSWTAIFVDSIFDSDGWIDLVDSGSTEISTTTILDNGTYRLTVALEDKCWYLFCSSIDYDIVRFAVGSDFDPQYQNWEVLSERFGSTTPSLKTVWDWTECTTDIPGCLAHLMIPSASQIEVIKNSFDEKVAHKAPFGYFTILYQALVASSTQTYLQNLTLTIPSGLPKGGTSITVINWDANFGSTSKINTLGATTTGDTFWTIVNGYFNPVFYVLTGIFVLFLLIRFNP